MVSSSESDGNAPVTMVGLLFIADNFSGTAFAKTSCLGGCLLVSDDSFNGGCILDMDALVDFKQQL
jgi:hypothetical protein